MSMRIGYLVYIKNKISLENIAGAVVTDINNDKSWRHTLFCVGEVGGGGCSGFLLGGGGGGGGSDDLDPDFA